MRLLVFSLIIVSMSSCSVDTSSSYKLDLNSTVKPDTNITKPDTNTTKPDANTTKPDTNSTKPDANSTKPDSNTADDCVDAIFDCKNAVLDKNACDVNRYNLASDASYGGSKDGENGASSFKVDNEGLWIQSGHLEAEPSKKDRTWVHLYYKKFPDSYKSALGNQGDASYVMKGVFMLSYDIAWSDESISGIDNVLYVQSSNYDKDGGEKPSCYRTTLNNVSGSKIDVTKVYR